MTKRNKKVGSPFVVRYITCRVVKKFVFRISQTKNFYALFLEFLLWFIWNFTKFRCENFTKTCWKQVFPKILYIMCIIILLRSHKAGKFAKCFRNLISCFTKYPRILHRNKQQQNFSKNKNGQIWLKI